MHLLHRKVPFTSHKSITTPKQLKANKGVTFVKHLRHRIQKDPSGSGVSPVAVLCTDASKEDFAERLKCSYHYEVLGGQHMVSGKTELFKENSDSVSFSHVLSEVYIALSDKEALRLASQHNRNGHFIHRMSHKDYIIVKRQT